ncbi:hypothetical protein [uncultured Nostoc sp.]|uniref:hypothetical protein n=1 Tax=uncultured Nostoc sp. TaxID=340711 RepID=UPI00261CC838|nr:hypothetical protein [uncultured Nostoc sp.]
MQQLQNPEIKGVEYQQGELFGFEVREYLLQKWARKCAYCGVENVPFEVEHIHPKSRGGSDRVAKGNQPVEHFLAKKSELVRRILAQAKAPLKDATAVNTTRWELHRRLQLTRLPIELGSTGRTKFTHRGFYEN